MLTLPVISHKPLIHHHVFLSLAPEVAKVEKLVLTGKVAILVGGDVESDAYVHAVTRALIVQGVKDVVQSRVPDVTSLLYAAQSVGRSADVVIVGGILSSTHAATAPALTTALLQAGLTGSPLIPAFITQPSLLEAKAILPESAESWAKTAASVLAVKGGQLSSAPAPAVEVKEKPVLTPQVSSVDTLMEILRESLKKHGASGIAGLSRKFRIVDDNGNGQIDIKEFSKAIGEHALGWTAAQVKAIFDHFDKDKSGAISFDEFLNGVRGQLNSRRKQLVLMAFERLDADKSGVIELSDIQSKYDASKHPDVISGKRTTAQVLSEFLDTFDTEEKDGKVTPSEFCTYYSNVSASIDNDDYFELMIRNAWHISGGEGWCANSSCLRVLVTHTDGRQTVEEVKVSLTVYLP
ncbi:hypothetical protein EON65_24245 [archaeon]|nr:MAG: hypothetical protein EON65_24245 [archaeon]